MGNALTKQQVLDAYRTGIIASAQMAREEMDKAGKKAEFVVVAMKGIANADKNDAKSLSPLIDLLLGFVPKFTHERDRYFDALKHSQLSDDELQKLHDEGCPRNRRIGSLKPRPVALLAGKTARRSRKAVGQ